MISNVSSGSSSGGIASYIGALASTNVLSGGAGITSHVAGLGSATQLSGAGISSYLDSVNHACDTSLQGDTTLQCADAISNYASALSSGDAP